MARWYRCTTGVMARTLSPLVKSCALSPFLAVSFHSYPGVTWCWDGLSSLAHPDCTPAATVQVALAEGKLA